MYKYTSSCYVFSKMFIPSTRTVEASFEVACSAKDSNIFDACEALVL